ncbi:MAG: phage tail sheath family protein [Burkholderiales bacterium]|nr:phage tail sheath family protein [Burkholderiales bacterium]
MAAQLKTPGVYINEIDGFGNSVVEVETAVPAFIGYTQKAQNGNQSLVNVPTRITSMLDYQKYFGADPDMEYTYVTASTAIPPYQPDASTPAFLLYYGMQMFFNNGGSTCFIVSLGTYDNMKAAGGVFTKEPFTNAFDLLKQYAEPTMLVMPETVHLSVDDWASVSQMALTHCNLMQSRIAILDIVNGYKAADYSTSDPIQGATGMDGFYKVNGLGEDYNKYGVAYYPWINTNIVDVSNIDYTWISAASIAQLATDLTNEAPSLFPGSSNTAKLNSYLAIVNQISTPSDATTTRSNHQTLYALSPTYQVTMNDLALSVNLLPPAAAMAGVYSRVDAGEGVYKAPANTTIINATSPAVNITDADQENLNVPLNGLAVNAIRVFPNWGLLIWGARTMAGNSDDWRYINVRRTMIMLEQSIKNAMQAYVFEPNSDLTWVAVSSAINNFLNDQWKAGALVGSKASDAYSVAVGEGITMTGQDILDGYMRVTVKVAVVHPAEFIVLTFQQQMQQS